MKDKDIGTKEHEQCHYSAGDIRKQSAIYNYPIIIEG
jgi:hypothetical protein